MVSLANYLPLIRRVTFVTTLVFSLIVLSLSAALISLTGSEFYFAFSGLALATSLLTLLTVGPMFFVDLYRKGTYFSWIVVEVSCLSILWILWLASGSSAAQKDQEISDLCVWSLFSSDLNQACNESRAIMGFSFLTWILLMSYTVTLLVLALRAQSQGHNVWQTSVRDGTLFYPSENVVGGAPQVVQPVVYQPYAPPTLAQQYYTPPQAQQYVPPQAQQYIPGGGPSPAQQPLPTSVLRAYPAQA